MTRWMTSRREFVRHSAVLAGGMLFRPTPVASDARPAPQYTCPPCGCAMDGRLFDAPGTCPACDMKLVEHHSGLIPFEPRTLSSGRGLFTTAGGVGHESHRITVAYYKPTGFTATSPMLLVLPGSSRDALDYREPWITRAERANMLVAALGYPEADYDYAAYQMGGVIRDLELRHVVRDARGDLPSVLTLRDEDIRFTVNPDRTTWLFPDFDRIFALLVRATGSAATHYDMFGHSAGAQILHRLALCHPRSKARHLLAANAGVYSMPNLDEPPLAGLAGTGLTMSDLENAFSSRLHLLLGEQDNDAERGGIHLHTPSLDRHGLGRLDRGRSFFAAGQRRAASLGVPFRWRLDVVPGVGHDHERMGEVAARTLSSRA